MIWGVPGRHYWIPSPYSDDFTPAQFMSGSTAGPGGIYPFLLSRRDATGAIVYPRFRIDSIGGMFSTGDSGDVRDNRVGAQGEIPRRSFRRGKTITYSGLLQETSRTGLLTLMEKVRTAFEDQVQEGLMIVKPPGPQAPDTSYSFFWAKALSVEMTDELKYDPVTRVRTKGFECACVIALRCARANGVFYTDQAGATYA